MKAAHVLPIAAGLLLLSLNLTTARAAETNASSRAQLPRTSRLRNNDDATIKPLTYVDPKSHTVFYVESDGRHVSAIAPDGKLLWHRNPFVDVKLQPYRFSKPVISWIGLDFQGRLGIAFNSSQFGRMDPTTGDFTFGGQD